MEKMTVKDIVRENKKNTSVFGVFMSEHINSGRSLRQFLAEERLKGRVPLRGEGSNYDPVKERVIIVAPREWGADAPDELVGASVRLDIIGLIPVSDDDDGNITVIRLTEATPGFEPDVVFDDSWVVENAALCPIGRNTWVRLNPPPMDQLLDDYDPDDDDDNDNDNDNDNEDSYF